MSITAQLVNFEAVSEFNHFTDTCGETAFLVVEHCKDGIALNGPDVDAVRSDMAAHGYGVEGGTIMSDLVAYFSKVRGLDVEYANHYGDTWEHIHQTLLDHAGRDGVVIEVEDASALTGNEHGVRRHYVAIGAIHPTRGYLVANGDDVMALNVNHGHGRIIPTRWMDKTVLAAARPSACAIVRGLAHTDTLSAAVLALPAGADGTAETVTPPVVVEQPAAVVVATPAPANLPRFFDASNIAALRDELLVAIQATSRTLTQLQAALQALPQPFEQ